MISGKGQIPALDGLRGLACLLVLFSHAGKVSWFYPIGGAGQFGVMLFFTLSGYLMSYHYLTSSFSWHDAQTFLLRRFFRIFPLLFVILACSWAAYMLHFTHTPPYTPRHLSLAWLWKLPLSLSATIKVECKFYLLFPFLCAALLCVPRHKLLALSSLWLILMLWAPEGRNTSLWPYLSFFIGGMAAEYAMRSPVKAMAINWNAIACACIMGIAICIFLRRDILITHHIKQWYNQPLLSPLMALTVASIAQTTGMANRVFANKAATFMGHISYSLFLLHPYVLKLHPLTMHVMPYSIIPVLAISLQLAWLSWHYIEIPCNRFGKNLLKPRPSLSQA